MKLISSLIALLVVANVAAAPLTPITSTTKDCTATITTNTYDVEAVCWRNKNGEARLYFSQDAFQSIKETKINAKYIENTEEACLMTTEYAYEDLFGDNKLDPRDIRPSMVTVKYSHLDTSACF
jgi:glutathionylspermidine synthase